MYEFSLDDVSRSPKPGLRKKMDVVLLSEGSCDPGFPQIPVESNEAVIECRGCFFPSILKTVSTYKCGFHEPLIITGAHNG